MTKLTKWIAPAVLGCFWSCGSPEQSTLHQYFLAAKDDDPATLASISTVKPPVEVASWKVIEVTSRTKKPYELPELMERYEKVKNERDTALAERKKYFEEHEDALARIIPKLREDPDYEFRGKLGEIQEEWLSLHEKRKEIERVYQELKRQVHEQTQLATRSVVRQTDLKTLQGDVDVTEMVVALKPKDGEELPYKFTLQKFAVTDPELNRTEPARWIITGIEGASPEAQAVVEAAAKARRPGSESASAESAETATRQPAYVPRELHGLARVQILDPETKVEGDEVVSIIRVRNISRDWIVGFTAQEHWYDDEGNAVRGDRQTYRKRFMPGEVIELELRTRKDPKFYQNQFEFSHANGDVKAVIVESFPSNT